MKVKVSMRYFIKLFDLDKVEVRTIFSGALSSDVLKELENRYPTLSDLSEATETELLNIPGIGEAKVKEIKSTLSKFIESLLEKDFSTGMPSNIPPERRLAYANLMKDGEIYRSIEEIDTAMKALPKKQRKFLKMCFGLKNKYTVREISKKLEIPVSEYDEFKEKALEALRNVIL